MGLQVWRSERADGLLEPLGSLLAEPPADPLAGELISVPTAGIERWLSQELALRLGTRAPGGTDGVCANVSFPFPGKVVGSALEAAGGLAEDTDVWRPDRLVWPLLAMAAAEPAADWWGPAAAHLASAEDGRRFSAARILADLFDRYAVHRPQMILGWRAGRDVGPDLSPIPARHAWQPALWRRLRARLDSPSTAERLDDAVRRIRAGDVPLALPPRLSVFGLTALPSSYLQVLAAVADQRDVHLFLLHPSPALWERVAATLGDGRAERGPRDRDPTADLPRHPVLSSWGRDAREMQVVFAALGAPSATHAPVAEPAPATLLGRLQADIRADRLPPGRPLAPAADHRPALADDDRSLQVHACHGRLRQVQVLRDAILHQLANDPDLEPRDVIVMCPDVEAFAPLIDAVFGAGNATTASAGTPALRVRLADRSIRQGNPVLKVVAELLELADGRLTAPEVLDLLGRGPVRRRFRFDDDALERLETWIPDLGIRWGLDGEDRERFGLPPIETNTWRFGLDRLLAGVAMTDEDLRVLAGIVPFDDVEGTDVDLAGRFAECIDRLATVSRALRGTRSIAGWREALSDCADQLTETSTTDVWMRHQLDRILDEFVAHAETGDDAATQLTLAEVRVLLADRLRGRPTRANHRTGDLTVCTLVPMRAVPHEVVCLLGMDDGSFPRRTAADGDDLIDLVPFVGDRDPRTEDRQLLLDALLSARRAVVVTYSGRDERTNEPLPPAVPLGELLDTVDATVRVDAPGDVPARERIVVEHPLQGSDARNFLPGALHRDAATPWSFDTIALAGAQARRGGLSDPPPFVSAPLPPRPEDASVLELDTLVQFLQHPSKAFLGQRLGVWFRSSADAPAEGLPLDLVGLPEWGVGDRLLRARLHGHTQERWERNERARGTLPPPPLDQAILDKVAPIVDALVTAAAGHIGDQPARSVEVDIPLRDGRRLVGTIGGVHGDTLAEVTYSKLKAKARVAAYARLAALTAAHPERAWDAVLVCRKQAKSLHEVRSLGPFGVDGADGRAAAMGALAVLVDLYDRGMRQPAPLYPETSAAIAQKLADGRTAWDASWSWETTNRQYGGNDDIDPCHVAALGSVRTFAELMEAPAPNDDLGPDWPDCEELVVAWARRLWDPIIALEQAAGA